MIGRILSHYEIIGLLGKGGMGEVYRARDTKLKRDVALKVLPAAMAADPTRLGRFQREAETVAGLNHPNIVTLFSVEEADGVHFLTMELVEGEDLQQALSREPLPLERVVSIGIDVSAALGAAHARGVVHRDLKPGNIVLGGSDRVKVLDFGLARWMGGPHSGEDDATIDLPLTMEGAVQGTAPYMAPEQVCGELADHRADIWALGVVLYEMVTGKRPFTADNIPATLHRIIHSEPIPMSRLRPDTPPRLETLVTRALNKERDRRYQSVLEITSELKAIQRSPGSSTETGSRSGVQAKPPGIRSLAVLPLDNLSGDPRQEYFADGMTEALITTLGKVGSLHVISRTSVMTYKGARKSVPTVARELNVDGIVEGTVLSVGEEVRITARLISAREDTPLWSDSFDRKLQDVLNLQTEVARAIAKAIEIELTGAEAAQLGSQRQVVPDAYRRELMGRHALAQRTIEGLHVAVGHFQQAAALDPTYAPAFAGLAEALLMLSNYGIEPPGATHQAARDAAERAIRLDPSSHEGHVSLAAILWQYEWAWDASEKQFKRAIELNPGSANAHHWYSVMLATAHRRFEQALAENRSAQALDPLSPLFVDMEGWLRVFEGRDDLAIPRLQYALELSPGFLPALLFLGLSLARSGRADEGVRYLEQAVEAPGRPARALAYLCYACARAGKTERAIAALAELEERSRSEYVPPYFLAIANSLCGRMDRAMEWLDRGFTEGDVMMRDLAVDAACDELRRDARTRAILGRMGLARSPNP